MAAQVPPDTSTREKIIGGVLDIVQLGWLLVGIAIILIIGSFFKLFIGNAGYIIGAIPGIAFALVFCFVKIHGLSVFNYLKLSRKHKKKTKRLPNIRKKVLSTEEKDALWFENIKVSEDEILTKKQKKKKNKKGLEIGHIF